METRGIWLPAPPDLLSWLRSPPVQALPSPGTFTETLRYLHLFVLCCLHCICATGRHKWHRAIILIAHSHSALCSDQETDSGGVTSTDGHVPSQIAEVGWLWQIRDPRPLDSTVAHCAFCSKHCINVSILPNCWILPLFCEHKNGIWVFFFSITVTQLINLSVILHIWPQLLRTLRWECFDDTIHLFHIITNMPKIPVDLGRVLLQPPSGGRSDHFLLPLFPCLFALF